MGKEDVNMAILAWLLIVSLIFFVTRIMSLNVSPAHIDQSIETLRNRYGTGELNAMEFHELKRQLSNNKS